MDEIMNHMDFPLKSLRGLRDHCLVLLPLNRFQSRFSELEPGRTCYLHCNAGVGLLKALNFLRQQGFKYLKSVKGGISAWSEELTPKCRGIEAKFEGMRPRCGGDVGSSALCVTRNVRQRSLSSL